MEERCSWKRYKMLAYYNLAVLQEAQGKYDAIAAYKLVATSILGVGCREKAAFCSRGKARLLRRLRIIGEVFNQSGRDRGTQPPSSGLVTLRELR